MSVVASSPFIHRTDVASDEKENSSNRDFESSSPVTTGRMLRSRVKKSFHPPSTSTVLPSIRLKSPYERPRRATAKPKGYRKGINVENDTVSKANSGLALSSLRNMSITAQKTANKSDVDTAGTSPDGGNGKKRKAPPASLMINSFRPQRPLPVVPQPLYVHPIHTIPLPSDFGLGQPSTHNFSNASGPLMSFPSGPSLSNSVSTGFNSTVLSQTPQITKMQVPLSLPRPPIPEVQDGSILKSDPMAGESVVDVRQRLQTVSKDLLRTAILYRPINPDYTQPLDSSSTISGTFPSSSRLPTIHETESPTLSRDAQSVGTIFDDEARRSSRAGPYDLTCESAIGFGLPASAADLLDADEGKGWFQLAGKEPDCCLAVRCSRPRPQGCSGEELKEYYGKLVPAHHLVYAANCAHVDGRPGPALDESGFPLPPTSILQQESQATSGQQGTLRAGIKIPMLHVAVPFPDQYMIIHEYLYLRDPARLLWSLLALPPPITLPGRSAPMTPLERMSTLPLQSIVERLKNLHKMWSNVVALGIKDEMLWRAMERAWGVSIQATQSRAKQTQPKRPEQNFMTVPMMNPPMSFGGGSLPNFWRVPSQADFAPQHLMSGLPVPPLPNHPRSAGIQSTGHVMGLPSLDQGPCAF